MRAISHGNLVKELSLYGDKSHERLNILARREISQLRLLLSAADAFDADIFLDIGANIGAYASVFSRRTEIPEIHAFEPSDCSYKEMVRNFDSQALKNVTSHQIALSDKEGFVDFLDVGELSGANAIADTAVGNLSARRVQVQSAKLDDVVPAKNKKAIIKIDVEGHELNVLRGAGVFISENDCIFQLEFLNSQAMERGTEFLNNAGYSRMFFLHDDYYFARPVHSELIRNLRDIAFGIYRDVLNDYLDMAKYAGEVTRQVRAFVAANPHLKSYFPHINYPAPKWV